MTDRIPLDDMNSDQLDALYERLEWAEAAVRKASALATRWDFTAGRKRAAIELRSELRRAWTAPAQRTAAATNPDSSTATAP